MTDQQRADTLSCLGETPCRTPHLDRVAADGVAYGHAYCSTPLCSPSRAAIHTGRYVHSNRVLANCIQPEGGCATGLPGMDDAEKTVSQYLAPAGFTCMHAGKWHLGRETEAQRGYVRFTSHRDPRYLEGLRARGLDWDEMAVFHDLEYRQGAPFCGTAPLPPEENRDAFVTDNALNMLEECARGEAPFALWCSFYGPHNPFSVPEPYDRMYKPEEVELPANFRDTYEGKPRHVLQRARDASTNHLDENGWKRVIAHYWGYTTFLDAQFGRLLDRLEELGLWDDTAIMMMSDHGEFLGEHRFIGKWLHFYESTIRSPLIIRVPGVTEKKIETGLVSLVDPAPTMLDILGVDVPPEMQGTSLLPSLRGEADADRGAVFGEHHVRMRNGHIGAARMIRTHAHKYTMYNWGEEELYDLESDPHEMVNRAPDRDCEKMKNDLRARLEAWMRDTGDFWPDVPEELLPKK